LFDAKGSVLGTFAIYFRQPGRPAGHHLQLIDMATQTAAVAINHDRTQWELSVSEGRYRRLVTSNVIGVIVSNTDGSILEANDLFLEWLGYTREELRSGSLRWDALTPPEWRETDAMIIAELMANGSCAQVEKEYFRKDGSRLPILVSGALLEGTPGDAICLIENLTKRKQAAAALQESEARYRDLVEHTDDLFCTHDLEGRLLSINEACVRNTGFSRTQLLAMNIVDILLPEMRTNGLDYLRQVREHGQVQGIMKILTAKKEVRLWEFNNSVRREGVAEPVVRGIAHDITARKHWERTLRESEERFRAIFEQAPLGIAEGVIATASFVRVNQRYANIVGYSKEELARMTFRDFTHPEDLDLDLVEFGRLAAGEIREYAIEKRYIRKDGATVWVNLSVTAMAATGSMPVHCMAMIEDVTERKNLEAQFLQAQKMEAVGQLSGGIAHDFNNIITVIKGRVGLLQQNSGFDWDQAECLDEIAVAAARAAALTQQLLAFSRRQVMQQRDIELQNTVRNIATMLRRVVREDITVRFEYSPEALWVHADSGMIEQMVMNLAVNARDAMPQGGELAIATSAIVVSEEQAARWPMAEAGRFVRLTVTDTGCGIAPEVLTHIFEPFFTTKKVGEGTGLGLATVYGIVQQHRGGVEVESRIGVGTTFEIYLPRCAAPTESTPPVRETPAIPGGTETILLVEDDAAVQMVACAVLERLGYKLHVADTGREALGIWKEHRAQIQLLLTDLVMPEGINGHELARQLKLERPELRVILTSGYSASVAGKDFPMDDTIDFLAKPYEIHALATMVRQSLDKASP
ncbi:MAG: PAS domain S-box protein, partial [Candidatus Didemnitutus sp.]|nr:PAS domain S-box protein [Candidatus Didemnitutus sp.]